MSSTVKIKRQSKKGSCSIMALTNMASDLDERVREVEELQQQET